MNSHTTTMATSHQEPSQSPTLLASGLVAFILLAALPARAGNTVVPWECSHYEGDAQTRCLNTFIELQREKIGQLEGQLQAQQGAVGQLKDQVDRQAAATADLQRQLSDRPTTAVVPAPYPYTYIYPPGIGFGLYLGRPWIYGSPFYYRPYWGPRYYRHWRH